MNTKSPLLWILLLIVTLVAVPSFLFYLDTTNESQREQTETEITQATIISTEIDNHDNADYQYTVAGKIYTSGEFGWADRVRPGDSVILHYNPKDPSQHSLGEHHPESAFSYFRGFAIIDFAILWFSYLVYRGLTKLSTPEYE
jgi:hypothetical protein